MIVGVPSRSGPGLTARTAAALALVLAELLGLSLVFDFATLLGNHAWWSVALLQISPLARLAVTLVGCTALFAGPTIRAEVRSWGPAPRMRPARLVALVAAHWAAVAGGWWFTVTLLTAADDVSLAYALGAITCGAGAGGSLALAIFPMAAWARLAVRVWPGLLVAGGVSLAAWGSGLVTAGLWDPLGRWTLAAVRGMLAVAGADPVSDPAEMLVGTRQFPVRIAPQCSGYEGIGLVVAFVGGYLWVFRAGLRFPFALALLPLGIVLAWVANAVRITALILIGSAGAPEVALGGFHSQAGWLAFNGVALGLLVVADRAAWFRRRTDAGRGRGRPAWTAAYLAPFLGLAAVGMVTAAASSGTDWGYPARVVVAGGLLWAYRRYYLRPTWSWAAVGAGLGVAGLWTALAPPPNAPDLSSGLEGMSTWAAAGWLACRAVGACLVVPVAEELAFRGYLSRRLMAARFERVPPARVSWAAVLGSSLVFGVMHREWAAGAVAGVVFALVYRWRGRLGDAVLAHATANAALLAWGAWAYGWAGWA